MNLYILAGIVIMIILFIIVLAICVMNNKQLKELNEYAKDGDLAGTLQLYYKKINDLRTAIHDATDEVLMERLNECEARISNAYSKLYVVNFDAFDDVTGKLSFSAAILNDHNTGIILTSIYGHSSSNTYIRYVLDGMTNVKLIGEEQEALAKAIAGEKKVLDSAK